MLKAKRRNSELARTIWFYPHHTAHPHATHSTSTHATHSCRRMRVIILFRKICNHCFCCKHKTSNRSSVLKCRTSYFSWVNDSNFHKIFELIITGIVTE